ncbi:MAG: HDOD domain-containing protein [Candidatus Manganitrophus sp. SB1]|nr:HDOD domain-containing protein [Candidatus Manganitrophus morganii]
MNERREEIRRLIKETRSLPTLPGIITKMSALVENDKTSIQEIARLVSSDQILSAKVLKLVNSPFYGFPGRVSTVSNALILLGVNVVKGLSLSASIFEMMEKNVVGLWEHSLGTAVAASVIAKRIGAPEAEEISTAALLHDIGKVIVKIKFEEDYKRFESLVQDKEISMFEAERELLGADHAEIGGWLAKSWYLPEKLIEPIAYHHDVEKATRHPLNTAIVHLADVLVKAGGFGFSGDNVVPLIQPAAWKKTGLTETQLEGIIDEIEDKLIDVKNLSLEIQATHDAPA